MTATVLPAVLVDLTNEARVSNSEQSLTRNTVLDDTARLKAEDMARLGYFAHTSPEGVTPWHWFNEAGYSFAYAGENLAINFTESVDVESAWLASPTHKANILNSHFTEIGIATIDGIYQGRPTTYVVQMFGTPVMRSIPEPKVSAAKVAKKEKIVVSDKSTPLAAAVLAPAVEGASVAIDQNLKTITETKEFVAVQNITEEEKVKDPSIPEATHYSTWYQRFIFMTPSYADRVYRIFIWIVIIALLLMTIIEIRQQHPRNILYCVLLIVIMFSFIYINKHMFITNFLS